MADETSDYNLLLYDGVFRSLKCFRQGFAFGGYQMAARFMGFFAETLWALNGRGMPFLNRASYLLHGLDRMLEFRKEQGYFQVQLDWAGVLEKEADRHRGKGEET